MRMRCARSHALPPFWRTGMHADTQHTHTHTHTQIRTHMHACFVYTSPVSLPASPGHLLPQIHNIIHALTYFSPLSNVRWPSPPFPCLPPKFPGQNNNPPTNHGSKDHAKNKRAREEHEFTTAREENEFTAAREENECRSDHCPELTH